MAINGIQFQKGLSLAKFMRDYGTEEQCEAALVKARWSRGYECPRCAHKLAYEFKRGSNRYWQCKACRYQTSLRTGTVMEHGRLPLRTWYLAIYLMTQSKTNIAALALMRQLGVSWKAAWLLKHKLMEVMVQREAARPLEGDVRAMMPIWAGNAPVGGRDAVLRKRAPGSVPTFGHGGCQSQCRHSDTDSSVVGISEEM